MFWFQAMLLGGVGLDECFSGLGWVQYFLVGLAFKKVTHVQFWSRV